MEKVLNELYFQPIVQGMIKSKNVAGAALCVESGDNSIAWVGGAGNIQADDQYFIASVTKLFVTAVVLNLRAEGRLDLEDKIVKFLPGDLVEGIVVFNGVDYSQEITLKQLMSYTSGIPDYFSQKQPDGKTLLTSLFEGKDEAWPLERALDAIRQAKPRFRPGQKAQYSDTNHKILERIIETIAQKELEEVFKELIYDKLNLSKTYVFKDLEDTRPVPLYYRQKSVHIPKYMASISAEGGLVSTAKETMIFMKAFFNGELFPKQDIEGLKAWKLIFPPGPFYYGIGIQRLPWILSPLKPMGETLGHWGMSGAFAFYNAKKDLYFTGTVNECSGYEHGAALRAMSKIINAV